MLDTVRGPKLTEGCLHWVYRTPRVAMCAYWLTQVHVWQNLSWDTLFTVTRHVLQGLGAKTYSLCQPLTSEAADICKKEACTVLLTVVCVCIFSPEPREEETFNPWCCTLRRWKQIPQTYSKYLSTFGFSTTDDAILGWWGKGNNLEHCLFHFYDLPLALLPV